MSECEDPNSIGEFHVNNMKRESSYGHSSYDQVFGHEGTGDPAWEKRTMNSSATSTASRNSRPRPSRFASYQTAASASSVDASGSVRSGFISSNDGLYDYGRPPKVHR